MLHWISIVLFVFVVSAFLAGILIPKILLVAFRKKLFDVPDERKIHTCAVPRLGGIAFKPVIFISIALTLGISLSLGHIEIIEVLERNAKTLAYSYCAIMMLYLVGMADDLIGVKYRAKFVIQIICSLLLIAGGLWIDNFHGLFGIYELPKWIGYPFTVLVVVFIINAINLIDGIDGLASGLSSVALLSYGYSFFLSQQYGFAIFAIATFGVLVPFFYYNVFGNAEKGRKIFMGDTGSLTIGIIICILAIKLYNSHETYIDNYDPFALAFSPLIIPCFDVVRVFIHRTKLKMNPFKPDKSHIHHKLLAIGMKQRPAMVTIVSFAIVFTFGNLFLTKYININLLLLIDVLIWTIANIWLSKQIKKKNQTVQ